MYDAFIISTLIVLVLTNFVALAVLSRIQVMTGALIILHKTLSDFLDKQSQEKDS